jgi:DNA-binding NarL/FixJ family response regulator
VNPDVLVLDMRMPRGDGRHVVRELAKRRTLPPTLILTTFDDEDAALDVIAAGARGFLLKDIKLDTLVQAVRTLAAGGTMMRPGISERVERTLAERGGSVVTPTDGDITTREREVLRLLVAGYSNREIARALFVAEGTVKNHVSNILAKLGVRDRTRAVLKAVELGYI